MIVECGHCGAPLDVKEGRRYTRCNYCKKSSEQRALRTIEAQTPPGWRPPAVWNPPAHVPANSAIPLRPGNAAGPVIAALIGFGVIGAVGIAIAVTAVPRKGGISPFSPQSGSKRLDTKALGKITLKETPEKLESITGVAMDAQHSMRVPLSHPTWDAVTFRWDPQHTEHVKDFFLNASGKSSEARKNLKALLGRRWEKDGFNWEGSGLHVSDTGDHISSNITIEQHGEEVSENPQWKLQSETLWLLVRHAALGVGDAPKKKELRDALGYGYPLIDLLKFDNTTDIDAADAGVKKVFPGAVRKLFIDLEYMVALDHPWYSHLEIAWSNKKGAKVKAIEMRPSLGTNNKWASQKAVDDCMTATFGKPSRVTEGDHLGGSRDTTWTPAAGGQIRVYEHMLVITLRENHWSKPMPIDVWTRAVTALDGCGTSAK